MDAMTPHEHFGFLLVVVHAKVNDFPESKNFVFLFDANRVAIHAQRPAQNFHGRLFSRRFRSA